MLGGTTLVDEDGVSCSLVTSLKNVKSSTSGSFSTFGEGLSQGTNTCASSSSCGLTSPRAKSLIASHGGASFPTTFASTYPCGPLVSSNVTSTAISTRPEVLLKIRYP